MRRFLGGACAGGLLALLLLLLGSGLAEARTSACGSHQGISLDNGFLLANNNWGSENVSGSPFQCVYREPDGTIGWHWDRPSTPPGTNPDFPEILTGPKPHGGGTGQTELLPIQVKNIDKIRVWRDGTHEAPGIMGPWSHTLSLWFTRNLPQGHNPSNITHEVMINLATMNYHWGREANLNDGHRHYDHTNSSPMGHWRIHIFNQVGHQLPLPNQINIKAFIDYLIQNETLTGDDWLAAVELGDEMNDNTNGAVHLTSFALGINGVRRSPTPELVPAEGGDEWNDWRRIENLPTTQTVAEGVYRIRAAHTSLPIGVENASLVNGALVRQLADAGDQNQLWELSYVGNGQYEIAALHSGKLLEVSEGRDGNGIRLRQWERTHSDHQRWHVAQFLHNRRFRIASARSRLAAEVGGGSQSPGAHLQQWEWRGSTHQHWEVELVSGLELAPSISDIADRTIDVNTSTGPIAFTVGHEEADPSEVVVSGSSSDTILVPNQNIVFGGSHAERTVRVTPATNRTGTVTITVTAIYGARTVSASFVVTVPAPEPLFFSFASDDLEGWTEAATDGQGRQFFALAPPSVSSPNTTPHSGSHFIGLHIPAFTLDEPAYTQDSGHDTLVMRSPEFTLNGSGDLTAWLAGGGSGSVSLAGTSVETLPGVSSTGGFLGVALRNVSTGTFVLSASKSGGGNEWEQVTFTEAQLVALPRDHVYTLDLIDARHGGWGWVNMDSVTIPGSLDDDGVIPALAIERSGGQVRLSWPTSASGWTLQRSLEVGSGYSDAGLPVTVEADKNVSYDAILEVKQFYRLAQ